MTLILLCAAVTLAIFLVVVILVIVNRLRFLRRQAHALEGRRVQRELTPVSLPCNDIPLKDFDQGRAPSSAAPTRYEESRDDPDEDDILPDSSTMSFDNPMFEDPFSIFGGQLSLHPLTLTTETANGIQKPHTQTDTNDQ